MSEKLPTLLHYDQACKALAAAVRVDEVKDIRDSAIAIRVYARQAKNRNAEADAVEFRMRAERRLGEMMRAQKETVGLNRGGRPAKTRVSENPGLPTLAEAGIDKNLAREARALAAPSESEFEQTVAEARAAVTSVVGKVVKSITLPKDETAASESETEIEITIPEWNAMSAAEREKYLDPSNFSSDAKLNPQNDADGTDYAQKSSAASTPAESTVGRTTSPCASPALFRTASIRSSARACAPANTPVPAKAAIDGRYQNVSSNFMSDMFAGWIPAPWIEATLAVERANPQWNFLHLTKFPKRLLEFEIPPNCWMGTTVDKQVRVANAEAAFAELREKYPDATFWLSIEPMLELIKFTRLYLFNWIVIGGAARSMRTPEWRPPHRAIMDLIAQANAVGCKVFEKTNLHGNRILELPFDAPSKHDYPQVAPDVFDYLNSSRRRRDDERLNHADYPLAHPFRHVSLLSLGGFQETFHCKKRPDLLTKTRGFGRDHSSLALRCRKRAIHPIIQSPRRRGRERIQES